MSLRFNWDEKKARSNKRKHGVTFEEAETVFGDFGSATRVDPLHSHEEDRFVTMGRSILGRVLVVVHAEASDTIRISAHGPPRSGNDMSTPKNNDPDLLDEYDFRGAVRGKYAARYARGRSVIVLEPDVAKSFPNSAKVNEALRTLIRTRTTVR